MNCIFPPLSYRVVQNFLTSWNRKKIEWWRLPDNLHCSKFSQQFRVTVSTGWLTVIMTFTEQTRDSFKHQKALCLGAECAGEEENCRLSVALLVCKLIINENVHKLGQFHPARKSTWWRVGTDCQIATRLALVAEAEINEYQTPRALELRQGEIPESYSSLRSKSWFVRVVKTSIHTVKTWRHITQHIYDRFPVLKFMTRKLVKKKFVYGIPVPPKLKSLSLWLERTHSTKAALFRQVSDSLRHQNT